MEWLGRLPQEHVLCRVAEADVFFFPCPRRGRAVIAEAYVVGLPVVCLAVADRLSQRDRMEPR